MEPLEERMRIQSSSIPHPDHHLAHVISPKHADEGRIEKVLLGWGRLAW